MAFRFIAKSASALYSSSRYVSIAAREILGSMPDPELTTLKNGFRVASENNGRSIATVGVWINSGSRYEDDENNGVANFLEHMIYKGTQKRSQSQLESELDSIGAQLSSYTSREHTAYFAQCASKDVEKAVDILSDVLRNSQISEAALERERLIILRQLEEVQDNYLEVVFDNLHMAAFQGTPLARTIYGPTANIRSLSRQQLQEYIADNYMPVRMVLCGVGGVDHTQLVKLSEKYFGDLKNDYPRKVPPDDKGIRFTGSEYRYRDDTYPFMYGAVAVEGVGMSDSDAIPLKIASTAVGQWDRTFASSLNSPNRVAQQISVGHDVEQYHSFSLNYKDCGLFGFYFVHTGNDISDVHKAVRTIVNEWKYLTNSVSEEEVDRAKNLFKTNTFLALETNAARADDIGKEVLSTGKIRSLASLEREIEAVDKKAIHSAMDRNVYDRDIATAGIGRTEAFPDYLQLRSSMSWWRL